MAKLNKIVPTIVAEPISDSSVFGDGILLILCGLIDFISYPIRKLLKLKQGK